jgi:hypothetical protein
VFGFIVVNQQMIFFFEKAREEVEKLGESFINILGIKLKIRSHSGDLDLPAKAAFTNTEQLNVVWM